MSGETRVLTCQNPGCPQHGVPGRIPCPTCSGDGLVYSGVEYQGASESIGCPDCEGTGYVQRVPDRGTK